MINWDSKEGARKEERKEGRKEGREGGEPHPAQVSVVALAAAGALLEDVSFVVSLCGDFRLARAARVARVAPQIAANRFSSPESHAESTYSKYPRF